MRGMCLVAIGIPLIGIHVQLIIYATKLLIESKITKAPHRDADPDREFKLSPTFLLYYDPVLKSR